MCSFPLSYHAHKYPQDHSTVIAVNNTTTQSCSGFLRGSLWPTHMGIQLEYVSRRYLNQLFSLWIALLAVRLELFVFACLQFWGLLLSTYFGVIDIYSSTDYGSKTKYIKRYTQSSLLPVPPFDPILIWTL